MITFTALTLLAGQPEWHPACKKNCTNCAQRFSSGAS